MPDAPTSPAPTPAGGTIHPPGDSLFLWQQMGDTVMPGGGIIDIWFVSPSKGVYAGLDNNLYRSVDSGKSWTIIPNSTSAGIQSLFFLDDQYGFAVGPQQLQVTRDGGASWSLKQIPASYLENVFFTTPSTGFLGDINVGLFKTTDTGNTLTNDYTPAGQQKANYSYFLNQTHGFVFSEDGSIAKTSDGGSSWQTVAQTSAVNSGYPNYNTVQFLDSLNGFYASEFGVMKTTDGGVSWITIYPRGEHVNIVKFFDLQTGYFLEDTVIHKTIDGGQKWSTSCKLTKDFFLDMHFVNSTTGWACTYKGYIFRINQ